MANDRVVLYSAMLTLGSTVGKSMLPSKYGGQSGLPSPRLLFGSALTFTGLAILADFKPELANPLSAAIAVTAVTWYGLPLMEQYMFVNQEQDKSNANR